MKQKLQVALGLAVGMVIFEVFKLQWEPADWYSVVLVPGIAFILFLPLPNRWFATKAAEKKQ